MSTGLHADGQRRKGGEGEANLKMSGGTSPLLARVMERHNRSLLLRAGVRHAEDGRWVGWLHRLLGIAQDSQVLQQ